MWVGESWLKHYKQRGWQKTQQLRVLIATTEDWSLVPRCSESLTTIIVLFRGNWNPFSSDMKVKHPLCVKLKINNKIKNTKAGDMIPWLKALDTLECTSWASNATYFCNSSSKTGWRQAYNESFSVQSASSQIMTWILLINYKSSVNSVGLFLTNSYNLN